MKKFKNTESAQLWSPVSQDHLRTQDKVLDTIELPQSWYAPMKVTDKSIQIHNQQTTEQSFRHLNSAL